MEDCFHLGIKALILNQSGELLLLQVNPQKLRNVTQAYWDIPGGRVQKGSTIEETLRREVYEEIGFTNIFNIRPFTTVLSPLRIPVKTGDVGLILSAYWCSLAEITPPKLSKEHLQCGWFALAEAANLLQVKYPPEFTDKLLAEPLEV